MSVTAEEYSQIRQKAYDQLMRDIQSDEVRDYAIGLGSNAIKGLIGRYLPFGAKAEEKE